ncbi:DUF3389 domain-containing protein [Photobacterium ganghwense]|uniref:PTS sugar transporter subunit IIA n=1 Tax=Photobacterium ganghwense TaxID=320778 RepID=A0A0J1H8V3_9GAMM|nr:DUF3389 domain-containing protein [Photobacterium ganghwense]KLV08076.1 PTS sugar transporter subunit IIA [Photobacterium ganghwense]PSU07196.1 DUF3389 domain-containing protein [Photobacterium ganghwense]QSV15950.1 DUF3389 domain-containing protein [Photobacterium ganghwense]
MNIVFSQGRVIANQYELVIRLDGDARITLQAMAEDVSLRGKGVNVVTAMGTGVNWSVRLDSEEQLILLADALGIAIS